MTDSRRDRQPREGDGLVSADPYATLGLPAGAPLGDVKRAYRRLAKAFHPDSAGAAALPRFLAIHEAYDRITTGRVLPGAARAPSGQPAREPWRADPARARATRARASSPRTQAGAAGTGPSGAGPSGAGASAGGPSGAERRSGSGSRAAGEDGARPRSGRRHATRKATLGSTSYDEARDRADATWTGASWYGPTTGEYWIINPREYADPRKHGPAYQARVGQAASEAGSAEATATQSGAAEFPFDEPAPESPRTRGASEASEARTDRATTPGRFAAASTTRPRSTGETRPTGASMSPAPDVAEPAARWPLLGDPSDDPIRRLRLTLVAWPPLGVAAAIAAGEATGCAAAAASCTGLAPLLPWLAQVAILGLLLLLPPLARLLATGTVAVLLALVPATAVLLALGAGGRPEASFALGVLLAVAWLVGVGYGAILAARRASLSSPG